MSKVIKRKKKTGVVWLGIVLTFLITAVILLGALIGAAFVIAKGPSRSASERMCATFAEKRFPLAGMFFSAEELERSLIYMPPKPESAQIEHTGEYTESVYYINDASRAWDAVVITGIDPKSLSLGEHAGDITSSRYAFGITGDLDAFLKDGYLSYRGGEGDLYCFCAMGADGELDVGAMTAYDAANSGYIWGLCAERVLISNGTPASDLGGGYSSRAAIGQAADGSIILVFANDRGIYPAGITYSELAALMYERGAVTAAALGAEGGFYAMGAGQLGSPEEPSFAVLVKGGDN